MKSKNKESLLRCINYKKQDGSPRSLEHRIYCVGGISSCVVGKGSFMPWILFTEEDYG